MSSPHHHREPDSLSPEKMQLFLAGLAGLPEDEVRKAKSLYLRNAIAEYRAMESGLKGFGCVQAAFMVVPFFWPINYAQRRMIDAQKQLFRDRIENALQVWRDDLRGEHFDWPLDDPRN